MNSAIRKNDQLSRYLKKYEFSLFGVQNLASTKNNINFWLICMPDPSLHLLKRWKWASQTELDENTFFLFSRKKKKATTRQNQCTY